MPISNVRREAETLGDEESADVLAEASRVAREDPADDLDAGFESDESVVAVEADDRDVFLVVSGDDGHRTVKIRARDFLAQFLADYAAGVAGESDALVDRIHTNDGVLVLEYAHRLEAVPDDDPDWVPPGHRDEES